MTGNDRPENEAGTDGQDIRSKDYYKTTNRPIMDKKTRGRDVIPGEMLKHVDAVPFLKQYLNAHLTTGYFPEFRSSGHGQRGQVRDRASERQRERERERESVCVCV